MLIQKDHKNPEYNNLTVIFLSRVDQELDRDMLR